MQDSDPASNEPQEAGKAAGQTPNKSRYTGPLLLLALAAAAVAISIRSSWQQKPGQAASFPWLTDLSKALPEAGRSGRPILVYLYADYCTGCQYMANNVFPQPDVGTAMKAWQAVKVNVEKSPKLFERYAIPVPAIPTFVVLNSKGQKVTHQIGPMDEPTFLDWLSDAARAAAQKQGRQDGGRSSSS